MNFETRIEVLGGGNVDYSRYPAVSLRIGRIGRRPHFESYLGCLFGLAPPHAYPSGRTLYR